MTYKAVRTDDLKYIHWVNRGACRELDEMYDLGRDPYELANVIARAAYADARETLRTELRGLVSSALGL
jgi:hypothetical protein